MLAARQATSLTRAQWQHVRRKLGNPRRLSPAFFAEERANLQLQREKVRMIQQGKVCGCMCCGFVA